MRLSRPSRFFAALLTLFCLLFTQLAVASYVCPTLEMTPAPKATMSHADMPGCQMDIADKGLCKAHCEAGNQSLDKPATPHVSPFIPAELAVVLVVGAVTASESALPVANWLARTTAPPLTIRNCCFRI